mgnify:CR=1 FL=1
MITIFLMIAYRYYSWASYSLFHLEGDFGSLYLLIPAAIVELFILYKVVKHSRINRNSTWSKVIALVVLTDLLYLAVCSILLYLAVAMSLWLGYSDRAVNTAKS